MCETVKQFFSKNYLHVNPSIFIFICKIENICFSEEYFVHVLSKFFPDFLSVKLSKYFIHVCFCLNIFSRMFFIIFLLFFFPDEFFSLYEIE